MIDQIRRNSVALISLAVALTALGYNTWRNEKTEHNRNQRFAAFALLTTLGQLQEVVFYGHYEDDLRDKGNPRTGWTYVLTIRDLADVLNEPIKATSEKLYAVWRDHWDRLGKEQDSVDRINAAIDEMRAVTKQSLLSLE